MSRDLFISSFYSVHVGTSNCTPGPNHLKYMMQSTDDLALNFGFYAKANSSCTKQSEANSLHNFAKDLEDQLIAGAIGLRLSESSGTAPSAIESAIRLADFYDVSVLLDMDNLNEASTAHVQLQDLLKSRVAALPLDSLRSLSTAGFLASTNVIGISSFSGPLQEQLHDCGVTCVATSSSFDSTTCQVTLISSLLPSRSAPPSSAIQL
jgi:hypothetical protein